ncbi:response regulator transcription factor [Pseudoalteromonas denitrificans]|uniref:DNA-binding response regulator, OmpR family, contains REC and winged-helix (WHTH) domain n=1 Tax=Pseudoalteromonas denitrificans DSM 6059 TaxID=1123010 RepID=A0A1I1TJ77_9GAMM|nr:response regulator transcription factor [Pseudoalteromonas denitrificans]SFD58587.1 DNA-binding response regulator, OmpR family, contains REC and winged-helix (wHTH) domain [Pseudoalteromonas denitrificans DSM 6059]
MLVLFAEDERDLAQLTIDFLEIEGIDCDYADNGEMAINLINAHQYDVIVLDISMPRLDGFSVCKMIKANGNNTPVIFLTARDALADKLAGFSLGADDYLTKPFDLPELAARIKVLAQRSTKICNIFNLDTLSIYFEQHKVIRGNREILLSPSQWQLLKILADHSPNVVSRVVLENVIWPDQMASKDMLKMLVFRLRSLIDINNEQVLIHTIRGAGIALRVLNEK